MDVMRETGSIKGVFFGDQRVFEEEEKKIVGRVEKVTRRTSFVFVTFTVLQTITF